MSAPGKNAETILKLNKSTRTREQLERDIRAFLNEASSKPGTSTKPGCPLNHGLACVLATIHDNVPRATPVDFFQRRADHLDCGGAGPENPQHPLKPNSGGRHLPPHGPQQAQSQRANTGNRHSF